MLRHGAETQYDQDDLQRLDHPVDGGGRQGVSQASEQIFEGMHRARQRPEYGKRDDRAQNASRVDFRLAGNIGHLQRDIDTDDDRDDLERRRDGLNERVIKARLGAGRQAHDGLHDQPCEQAADHQRDHDDHNSDGDLAIGQTISAIIPDVSDEGCGLARPVGGILLKPARRLCQGHAALHLFHPVATGPVECRLLICVMRPVKGWGSALDVAPLAGGKAIQGPVADLRAHKAQGWMPDCGGHAPDLSVAAFDNGQFDPAIWYRFSKPDWRVARPEISWLVHPSHLCRSGATIIQVYAGAEGLQCLVIRNTLDLGPVDFGHLGFRIGNAGLQLAVIGQE